MSSLDEIAPSFRRAKDRWPDAQNLKGHYEDLAATFDTSGSSLIELCKSYVETVCITILTELGDEGIERASTTEYVTRTLEKLGLRQTRGAGAIGKVLSSLNRMADALTECRNADGGVAHGKDGFLDVITGRHARVYILAADTILSFVLDAFDRVTPDVLYTREPHERFAHYNIRIDNGTAVTPVLDDDGMIILNFRSGTLEEGFDLRASASELLYNLDRPAYVAVLNSLRGIPLEEEEPDVEEEEDQEGLETAVPTPAVAEERMPQTKPKIVPGPITKYSGRYADLSHSLYDHLYHIVLNGSETNAKRVENLAYTLLHEME
ncbi:MAG: abortive infection family protein, partial [Candidatus Omnitrophica bacterium]|nr:abortive infection family protein [Candidatus Omnitrophota bacterium]